MSLLHPHLVQEYQQALRSGDPHDALDVMRKVYRELMELDERIARISAGETRIYYGGGARSSGATGGSAQLSARRVVIPVSAWTVDTANHPRAPEDYYSADIQHNLNNERARADHFMTGGGFLWTDIAMQQCRNAMTLRIWLKEPPPGDLDVLIVALK